MRGVRTAYFGDTKDTRLRFYLLVWFMSLKYPNGTCSLAYRYLRDTTLAPDTIRFNSIYVTPSFHQQ